MEFDEISSPHFLFPIIGVVTCVFLVFAFGFKSPILPPSYDFNNEDTENKKITKKIKSKKLIRMVNDTQNHSIKSELNKGEAITSTQFKVIDKLRIPANITTKQTIYNSNKDKVLSANTLSNNDESWLKVTKRKKNIINKTESIIEFNNEDPFGKSLIESKVADKGESINENILVENELTKTEPNIAYIVPEYENVVKLIVQNSEVHPVKEDLSHATKSTEEIQLISNSTSNEIEELSIKKVNIKKEEKKKTKKPKDVNKVLEISSNKIVLLEQNEIEKLDIQKNKIKRVANSSIKNEMEDISACKVLNVASYENNDNKLLTIAVSVLKNQESDEGCMQLTELQVKSSDKLVKSSDSKSNNKFNKLKSGNDESEKEVNEASANMEITVSSELPSLSNKIEESTKTSTINDISEDWQEAKPIKKKKIRKDN